MPTAWTSPRTWVALDKLTAAQLNTEVRDRGNYFKIKTDRTPRGLLGVTLQSSDQLIANSASEFSSMSVSFNVAALRNIKITWSGRIQSSDAGDTITIRLKEGSTELMATTATIDTPGGFAPGHMTRVMSSPSEGLHTFTIYATRPFGSGTGGFRASSAAPSMLLVEDIGSAISTWDDA